MKYGIAVLIIVTFSAAALAETGGILNTTTSNVSIVTGFFGYTVDFCNANYECQGYTCFIDWDNTGSGGKAGWCNLSSVTSCYHNGTATATGSSACDTSTSYRTCTNGVWGASVSCSSNITCSAGSCTSSSSSSSGSASSSTSNATNLNQAIKIISSPSDFNITQGNSVIKTLVAKNIGNRTLFNVTLNLSGIDVSWVSIGPNMVNITINSNATFGIEFKIPKDAAAKIYDVKAEIATSNASVKASADFKVSIMPTEETIQTQILPDYNNASTQLSELDKKIKGLEETCTDTKILRTNRDEIKAKITEIENAIQNKDYARANTLLDEVKVSLNELNQKVLNTTPSKCAFGEISVLYIAIGVAITGVAAVLVYMFWPQKPEAGYHPERGWTHPEEKKLKKKKKEEDFLYDFKRKNK